MVDAYRRAENPFGGIILASFRACINGPYSVIRARPPQLPPFLMLLEKIILVGKSATPIVNSDVGGF